MKTVNIRKAGSTNVKQNSFKTKNLQLIRNISVRCKSQLIRKDITIIKQIEVLSNRAAKLGEAKTIPKQEITKSTIKGKIF